MSVNQSWQEAYGAFINSTDEESSLIQLLVAGSGLRADAFKDLDYFKLLDLLDPMEIPSSGRELTQEMQERNHALLSSILARYRRPIVASATR